MFENIIDQVQVVDQLRRDIANNALPHTLLLEGPRYSGKLTLALEIARALTCRKQSNWDCDCAACARQRLLLHPALLLTGGRYFLRDIDSCLQALLRTGSTPAAYRFLRAVRTLTRRFDPLLHEGESAPTAAAVSLLETIEDSLMQIDLDNPPQTKSSQSKTSKSKTSKDGLRNAGSAVLTAARRLVDILPADGLPVRTVRAIASWVHITTDSAARIIIIEQSEHLHTAAINALLKILEQPPQGVYFILLASRQTLLPETIQSRLRVYRLIERGEQATARILTQLFGESEQVAAGYRHIGDYFLGDEIGNLADRFLGHAVVDGAAPAGEVADDGELTKKMETALSGSDKRDERRLFFEQLTRALSRRLREQSAHKMDSALLIRSEQRRELIERHYHYSEVLNIGFAQVMASLSSALRMVGANR